MALGDETILGPYDNNAAGHVTAGAAMDAATVTQHDAWVVLMDAGNIKFSIIHIEGG